MAKIYDDQHTIKDEWIKIKNEPLKVKAQWYWDYFGWLTIGVIIVIIAVINIVSSTIENSIPRIIQGEILTDSFEEEKTDEFFDLLCEKMGVEKSDYRIDVNYSIGSVYDSEYMYALASKIAARVAASDIDYYIGAKSFLETYVDTSEYENSAYNDLKEFLPAEIFEKLEAEDRIIYIADDAGVEHPVFIDIKDTTYYNLFEFTSEDCCLGIVCTGQHMDAVQAMIKYFIAD